jgi:23S rRNA (guanosine2251-2'-O)-methyltransferase
VAEALKSGARIDRVFMEKGHKSPVLEEIRHLCRQQGVPLLLVPVFKLDRLTRKNHQGVVALVSQVEFMDLEEVVTLAFEKGETPLIMVLDGITDVRNFGAIARTAECAGAHALVITEKNAAPVNEDAVKTSSGALLHIPVCREKHLKGTLELLQRQGLRILACSEKGNDSIYRLSFQEPMAIVMGAEDTGISSEVLRISDYIARIPMAGETASLNVSVAAGIVLFECLRQRSL